MLSIRQQHSSKIHFNNSYSTNEITKDNNWCNYKRQMRDMSVY